MRILVLSLAIFLFGCTTIEKQAKPTINSGEKLYQSNCSLCHRLYSPNLYTYNKLEKYIKKFGRGLGIEERRKLSEYLKEVSREQ